MTYSMKCTCGHVMRVDANSMDEAKTKMKAMMTEEELKKHMDQFHKPDEPRPTLEQAHMQIDQMMVEGDQEEAPKMN